MPATVNEFLQGVDRDTDNLKIKNTFLRDALNVRVINVNGQGFVATNLKGSKKRFELNEGFIALGHCVYGGVAYIASYNPDTQEGEIGSFPSPNATGTGFPDDNIELATYSPLKNYTTSGNPRDYSIPDDDFTFNLSILKHAWDSKTNIRMFGRIDYDNSTNIYFADNNNPNFVINSGFRQDGSRILETSNNRTKRRYGDESFPNYVSMFHESVQKPNISAAGATLGLVDGGSVRAGNWHIFVRYMNESFDTTSWSAESNALSAGYDDTLDIISKGDEGGKKTSKKIVLTVENLDRRYSFIEVGYQYSSDGNEEFGILENKFDIPEYGGAIQIEVNGSESIIPMERTEMFKQKPRFDTSKDHLDLEGRYWMSNLKDSTGYNDSSIEDLREFAKAITCGYTTVDKTFRANVVSTNIGDPKQMRPVYGNHENVYDFSGYFRGEMYPFAVVYILKNGRETEAFPIQGQDDYTGVTASTNFNGVYRFPNIKNEQLFTGVIGTPSTDLRIMGIEFDPSVASGTKITTWINDNVEGYYFVRGERIKNLQYQGLSLACVTTDNDYKDNGYLRSFNNDSATVFPSGNPKDPFRTFEKRNKNFFPLLFLGRSYSDPPGGLNVEAKPSIGLPLLANVGRGEIPPDEGVSKDNIPGSDKPTADTIIPNDNNGILLHAYTGLLRDNHKHGVISPDFHFLNTIDISSAYVVKHHKMVFNYEDDIGTPANNYNVNIFNAMLPYFYAPFQTRAAIDLTDGDTVAGGDAIKIYHVLPHEVTNNAGFISKVNEGSPTGAGTWYYTEEFGAGTGESYNVRNAPFALPGYIGLDMTSHNDMFNAPLGVPQHWLVGVYNRDPALFTSSEIEKYYDPGATVYHKISRFYDITDVAVTAPTFQGDCFLQRTFIKTLTDTRAESEGVEISKLADTLTTDVGLSDELQDSRAGLQISDTFNIAGLANPSKDMDSFGYVLEIISENTVNTEMRHDNFNNKCYPQSYSDELEDLRKFATKENDQEATEYNIGYSQILSAISYLGNNVDIPAIIDKQPTRIQYSDKHINGSFVDAYKNVGIGDNQDYDYRMGEITSIRVIHGRLFSIQERGINYHHVNDRAVLASGEVSNAQLTIGTGDVLAEKFNNVTDDYGSQHISSIIESDNFIYGVDFNKRKIWRVNAGQGGVELISDTKFFRRDVVESCEFLSQFSDASHFLEDSPNDSIGIVSGFDRKFNELNFTFIGFSKGSKSGSTTLAFSEAIGQYLGKRTYTPHMYITIEEDFFNTGGQILLSKQSDRNEFFYHDSDEVPRCFFNNVQTESKIEATVNVESDVIKDWYNWEISAGPEVPVRVEYETEHQTGVQDPYLATENYLKPEYRENKWFLPFRRVDAIVNDPNGIYGNQTAFRGDYITIKLFYTDQVVKVKSFVTWFEKSNT